MNAYYQFAMLDGYNYAAAGKGTSIISGGAEEETKEPTLPTESPSQAPTESEVTVDGGTGELSTPASKGGARGGGFGGGGGKGKGKGKGKAPSAGKKAMLPLVALGVGVAILIFKPFKFLK